MSSRVASAPNGYFSEVLMATNLLLSLVPTPSTAVMMAIAMPAAISPYSIAVAPDSSAIKFRNIPAIVIASFASRIARRRVRKERAKSAANAISELDG
jgi:hypothetical protein